MQTIFIFHGTEGCPEENWFPWLKQELEKEGCKVFVPQFPSPPVVPAKINEWFDVLKEYEKYITEETVLISHSLGGIFTLRALEKLSHPVKAASIKKKADHFVIFQSDNDPYVSLGNGKELAKRLDVEMDFIPNAGHFNKKAGYVKFEKLKEKVLEIL